MRNSSTLLLINTIAILLIAFSCGACSPAGQVVFSQNFENISTSDDLLTKWYWKHGQGTLRLSDDSHSDSKSLYYKVTADDYWSLISSENFDVIPDRPYVVTAWVKITEGSASTAVRLVAITDTKEICAYAHDVSCVFEHGQWKHIMNNIIPPQGCKTMRLEFCVKGASEGWIDDVKVKPWNKPEGKKLPQLSKARLPEKLSRGTAAVAGDEGIHISWRLLNTDPSDIAFDLYRRRAGAKAIKINAAPIVQTTDFADMYIGADIDYQYAAVTTGTKPQTDDWSIPVNTSVKGYTTIPMQGDYTIHKLGIGDLDGDGHLDYVIQQPDKNVDPYSKPGYWYRSEGTYKLEAYRHDGKFLWQYDLGWAIEQGTWYSPYIVCDMNQDGRCEVIVKTGPDDPRDSEGKVTGGAEFLTVLDGATGEIITQRTYEPKRGEITGPRAYNRYDSRNQFAVAYLDGKTPCLIVERGTYELVITQAYWLNGEKLEKLWQWRSDQWTSDHWGQGAHSIRVGDVDGDGREEVLLGSVMLDDDGSTLWTTGQGHPDHCYMGDLDPQREGLEIYMGLETRQKKDGYGMVDATSGKRIWGWPDKTKHVHSSGLVADLDANLPGAECYGRDKYSGKPQAFWFDAKGNVLSRADFHYAPKAVYWDADPQRELIGEKQNKDFSTQTIGREIEGEIIGMADLYGDWREEIITTVEGQMRIYSTTIPARNRWVTLLQDPIYRKDVYVQSNGYLQEPTLSYDMASEQEKLE